MSHYFGMEKYFSDSESWLPEGIGKELRESFEFLEKTALFRAAWLLQGDWKSSCNPLLFTLAREVLTTFNYWQLESSLKQTSSLVETNWSPIGNGLGQLRSVRIRRFTASFQASWK